MVPDFSRPWEKNPSLQGSKKKISCRKLEWWSFEHLSLQGPWLIFSSSIDLEWWSYGFSHAWRNLGLQRPALFFLLAASSNDGCPTFLIYEIENWTLNAWDFLFLVASSGDGHLIFSTMRRKPGPRVFFFLGASLGDGHPAFLICDRETQPLETWDLFFL